MKAQQKIYLGRSKRGYFVIKRNVGFLEDLIHLLMENLEEII